MLVNLPTLSSWFKIQQSLVALPPATPTQVLAPNSNRFYVGFVNQTVNGAFLAPAGDPLSGAAYILPGTGALLEIWMERHGALVSGSWFGNANVATSVGVFEVIYMPPQGVEVE